MTSEFDKILIDSRGIKRTMIKLEQADVISQIILRFNYIEKPSGNREYDGKDSGHFKLIESKDRSIQGINQGSKTGRGTKEKAIENQGIKVAKEE